MQRRAVTILQAAVAGISASCAGFRSPADLKYPQVLAVRLDQPQLMPGQRARIDVLVTDGMGAPSVIRPSLVELAPDPATGKPFPLPPEAASFIEREGDDFFAHAPDEATLDELGALLGLAADAALKIQLRVTVGIGEETRRADKLVVVLRPASGVTPTPNPTILEVRVDDQPVSADPTAAALDLAVVAAHTLSVTADDSAGPLTYAWFTAVGDIRHYRDAGATLTVKPEAAADGAGLIVVRNDRGGVTWRQFALHVH